MAKIRFLNDVVTYNHETDLWECPTDPDAADQMQMILENVVRSPNECMHYFAQRYGATVLEWDDESLPKDERPKQALTS